MTDIERLELLGYYIQELLGCFDGFTVKQEKFEYYLDRIESWREKELARVQDASKTS